MSTSYGNRAAGILAGLLLLALSPLAHSQDLNPDQKRRSESLTSIWENSQITKAYGYAEDINDGRGVTFGWYGATTADGDAIPVLNEFARRHPNNPLTPFMDQVYARNVTDEAGFIQAVHDSDTGDFQADFEAAQDYQAGIEYYAAAQQLARENGLQTAAALAELYDSEINHGDGGVHDMVTQTNNDMGGSPANGIDEIQWLDHYLDVRYAVLAADPTWQTASDRATVFKSAIVDAGNLNLDGPIHIDSPQYGSYDIP